jgi:hypothetical protein
MKYHGARILVWCLCAVFFQAPFLRTQAVSVQQAAGAAAQHEPSSQPSQSPPAAADSGQREDFGSLSLGGRVLESIEPIAAPTDQEQGFTRQLVEVQWRPGDAIHLYVILPEAVKKPPVVLYLYSYPTETDRFRDDDFCRRVTQGGYAAVGFVSALTGHRYHDVPMKQWFVSELPFALTASVHDVQMILNYLETRGDVDMRRVGMFGQGSGGTIAVLAAAVDPRIRAVELLNPWGDWPNWMAQSARVPDEERPNYVTQEFLDRVAPLDPVKWLPKLESRPIRILDAMDDPYTPAISKKHIEAAAAQRSVEVTEYDKADEMYKELGGGKLFEWIKEQFQPDADRRLASEWRP